MADALKNANLTPEQQKEQETYMEWAKRVYGEQYESWMPWIQDNFLKYLTKDNKASYAAKDTLGKTKVTGVEQVDNLQDGINNTVGSQFGKGGIAQPVGDMASKDGINRAQRQGKDNKGQYAPGQLNQVAEPVATQAKAGANYVSGAGQKLGGMMGMKKDEKK